MILGVLLVGLLFFGGCISSTTSQDSNTASQDNPIGDADQTEKTEENIYAVGETAQVGDLSVTVGSAKLMESYLSEHVVEGAMVPYDVVSYEEDMQFLLINVEIMNTGGKVEAVSSTEFDAIDKYGNEYLGKYCWNGEENFVDYPPVTLYKDMNAGGNILYEVPTNVEGLKIVYRHSPDSVLEPDAIWKVQ